MTSEPTTTEAPPQEKPITPVVAPTDDAYRATVREAMTEFGFVDEDAVTRMIRGCRAHSPEATAEEIVYFVVLKGKLLAVKKVENPIGFLLTAVVRCFEDQSINQLRAERSRQAVAAQQTAARQERELGQWRQEQEARLADPNEPEEEKRLIRRVLGIDAKGAGA